jgi:hypothetical protein
MHPAVHVHCTTHAVWPVKGGPASSGLVTPAPPSRAVLAQAAAVIRASAHWGSPTLPPTLCRKHLVLVHLPPAPRETTLERCSLQIRLVRDVDGATFGEAIEDSLTPRMQLIGACRPSSRHLLAATSAKYYSHNTFSCPSPVPIYNVRVRLPACTSYLPAGEPCHLFWPR